MPKALSRTLKPRLEPTGHACQAHGGHADAGGVSLGRRYVQLPINAAMPEAHQNAWQHVGAGGREERMTLLEVAPLRSCRAHPAHTCGTDSL